MAFQTITIGSDVFNSIGDGVYRHSGVAFGDPINDIKITPGKKAGKTGPTTTTVTRIFEFDVTVGAIVERRKAVASLQLSVPDGASLATLDSVILSISDLLSVQMLTRILQGES